MTISVQPSRNILGKILGYLNKNYQFLIRNPRLFWMRKVARFEFARNWISSFYRRKDKSFEIGENPSVFEDLKVNETVASLEKNSYCLGLNLPEDVVKELLDYAKSTVCYADRDPELGFLYSEKEQVEAKLGKQLRLGSYFNAKDCPAVKKLERDPGLLAIAAKFLGAPPVHMATEIWWSFPVTATPIEQLKAAQVFHYDLDDYRFIKFFFYLTDVDLSSGPHILIRGSHRNKKFLHQLLGVRCASKDDKEIVDAYGAENLVTICGSAGLGFVEDSMCFHKGTVPTERERLLLQIEYAINDYGQIREFR
ncbi:MAG TPA: phytanoyl-CoA dioxygenase family protein [Coleofasciculaceae cyanobacterium]